MKRIWIIVLVLIPVCSGLFLLANPGGELTTPAAKLSYALGQEIGGSLKTTGVEIDLPAFMQGVEDALKENQPLMTPQEAEQIKKEFLGKMEEKRMRQINSLAATNKEVGEKFLAENKNKPGVFVTASGLQYSVITEGAGPSPKKTDRVKVHYQGTLIDGTIFDSSYKRGEPIAFPLDGVIPGWTEGLQLMKVGGKYRFFIPSNLAYGESGAGQVIAPNSTLIFEVELLGIE